MTRVSAVVSVPRVLLVDWKECVIYMEFVTCATLRDAMASLDIDKVKKVGIMIGGDLAKIHDLDLIHGM